MPANMSKQTTKEVKQNTKQEKQTQKQKQEASDWLAEEKWVNKYEVCYICNGRFRLRDLVPEPTPAGVQYICVKDFGGDSE